MISEIEPYNSYTGDGETTQFDFDFYVETAEQLVVTYTDSEGENTVLINGVDYSIHKLGKVDGSYITFPLELSGYSVLNEHEKITLELSLPFEQTSDYGESSNLNLQSIEYSLDYLTRLAQILKQQISNIDTSGSGGGGGGGTITQVQSDWNQSNTSAVDYIKNKPSIPSAQVQANWEQSSSAEIDYIKNKPVIPTKTSDLENNSNFITPSDLEGLGMNFVSSVDCISSSNTAVGSYTLSFSSYLPNDNNSYLVYLQGNMVAGWKTSGSTPTSTTVHLGSVVTNMPFLVINSGDSMASYPSLNSRVVKIDSNRTLAMTIENAKATSLYIYVYGYSKLG